MTEKTKKHRSFFTKEDDYLIINSGLSVEELAKKLKHTAKSISSRRQRILQGKKLKLENSEDKAEYKRIRKLYEDMGYRLLVYKGVPYYSLMISNTRPALVINIIKGEYIKQYRNQSIKYGEPYININFIKIIRIFLNEAQIESFEYKGEENARV